VKSFNKGTALVCPNQPCGLSVLHSVSLNKKG
jgi:hypothetical protein